MKASILLGSADEYKHWLVRYATYLAEQEFVGRAEELLKDLIGPVYMYVTVSRRRVMGLADITVIVGSRVVGNRTWSVSRSET
jgi:hypothetical protein